MSGKHVWPSPAGVDPKYDRCVYAVGQYWWAYQHPTRPEYLRGARVIAGALTREQDVWHGHVLSTCHRPLERPALPPTALYSAVFLNPTGMGWVKQPYGPLETLRAPYEEILELVKRLAEKYPDTRYTVVKVCAEVSTPPKPTLEVKEY